MTAAIRGNDRATRIASGGTTVDASKDGETEPLTHVAPPDAAIHHQGMFTPTAAGFPPLRGPARGQITINGGYRSCRLPRSLLAIVM